VWGGARAPPPAFVFVPIGLHFANSHDIYEILSPLESNEAVCLGVNGKGNPVTGPGGPIG
jgi:hypothetical protein